jgi:hypothetical protein
MVIDISHQQRGSTTIKVLSDLSFPSSVPLGCEKLFWIACWRIRFFQYLILLNGHREQFSQSALTHFPYSTNDVHRITREKMSLVHANRNSAVRDTLVYCTVKYARCSFFFFRFLEKYFKAAGCRKAVSAHDNEKCRSTRRRFKYLDTREFRELISGRLRFR